MENWACIASLIATCKLNGVDPQAYLTDVLTKPVNHWPASRLDKLMPWTWAAERASNRQNGVIRNGAAAVPTMSNHQAVRPKHRLRKKERHLKSQNHMQRVFAQCTLTRCRRERRALSRLGGYPD